MFLRYPPIYVMACKWNNLTTLPLIIRRRGHSIDRNLQESHKVVCFSISIFSANQTTYQTKVTHALLLWGWREERDKHVTRIDDLSEFKQLATTTLYEQLDATQQVDRTQAQEEDIVGCCAYRRCYFMTCFWRCLESCFSNFIFILLRPDVWLQTINRLMRW